MLLCVAALGLSLLQNPKPRAQEYTELRNLFEAIVAKDLPQVQQLLKKNSQLLNEELPSSDPEWMESFASDVAARDGSKEILKLVIDYGGCLFNNGRSCAFPLMYRVMFGTSSRRSDAPSDLEEELRKEQLEKLRFLIQDKGLMVTPDPNGFTLFMDACRADWYEAADLLCKQGANINAKTPDGATAIFFVNTPRMAEYLFHLGLDPNTKTDKWGTPILGIVARTENEQLNTDLLRVFIKAGANWEISSQSGITPLNYAVRFKQPSIVRALITLGANPNGGASDGLVPLNYAAECMRMDSTDPITAKTLLDNGASVTKPNGYGDPPALGLVRRYLKTFRVGHTGPTPAGWEQYMIVLRLLKDRGADLAARNQRTGEDALYLLRSEAPRQAEEFQMLLVGR